MKRIRVILSKEFKNLGFEEVKAVLEIENIRYYINKISDYEIEIEIPNDSVFKALNSLCRAALIKEIEIENFSMKFIRSIYFEKKPIKKVNTCGAPLEPLISRLLVNLARIKEGYKVLDPFSGVGGLLFEVNMIGAHVIAIDIYNKYLKVLKENIPNGDIINSDTSFKIPLRNESIDAIISDPPYGRLSIIDIDIECLYQNFAREAYRVLKKGKYIAISHSCNINSTDYFLENGFELKCLDYQRVHSNLIRIIQVFQKI